MNLEERFPLITELVPSLRACRAVSGGCINEAYQLETAQDCFFLKLNEQASSDDFFAKEAKGLQLLEKAACLRVPKVLSFGYSCQKAYLLLEYIELQPCPESSQKALGEGLAKQHLLSMEKDFGLSYDNFIGSSLQKNTPLASWPQFFIENRLSFQLELLSVTYQDIKEIGLQVLKLVPSFFEDLQIKPSLLHGDLWYGNVGIDASQQPVIFDPAVYFGHHEAELSIMKIFGGFGPSFYNAYHALIPQSPGFDIRQKLYMLYHFLNHLNLFGGAYHHSVTSILRSLLA